MSANPGPIRRPGKEPVGGGSGAGDGGHATTAAPPRPTPAGAPPLTPPFAVTPWLTFADPATEAAFQADTGRRRTAAALRSDRAAYGFMAALLLLGGGASLNARGWVVATGAGTAALGAWCVWGVDSYTRARPLVATGFRWALAAAAAPGLAGGRSRPVNFFPAGGAALATTPACPLAPAPAALGAQQWARWAATRPVALSTLVLGALARLPLPALATTLAGQVALYGAGAPVYCPGVMASDLGACPFYERVGAAFSAAAHACVDALLPGPAAAPPGAPPFCPARVCELVAAQLHVLAACAAFVLAWHVEAAERAAWVGRQSFGLHRHRRLPCAVPGLAVVAGAAAAAVGCWLALEEVDAWFACPPVPGWADRAAAVRP